MIINHAIILFLVDIALEKSPKADDTARDYRTNKRVSYNYQFKKQRSQMG